MADFTTKTNFSAENSRDSFLDSTIVIASVLSFCVALALLLNGIFALNIFLHTEQKTRLRVFLLNIVAADVFICAFTLLLEIGLRITATWRAGDTFCRILSLTKTVGLYAESYVILAMSVDHYHSSLVLRLADAMERYERIKILLGISWIAAVIFSFPQAIVYHEEEDPADENYKQCMTLNSFATIQAERTYIAFELLAVYGLPLAIIVPTNLLSMRKASRSRYSVAVSIRITAPAETDSEQGSTYSEYELESRCSTAQMTPEEQNGVRNRLHTTAALHHVDHQIRLKARRQFTRLAVFMATGFFFTHTPYVIFVVVLAVADENSPKNETLLSIAEGLMMVSLSLSSILNPILYGIYIKYFYKQMGPTERPVSVGN